MNKAAIRQEVWDELEARGVARFPFPPHGRIPNFDGADRAADRLAATDAWAAAGTIKSNPDSPQRPVRRRALEAGKIVYMAVPRLRDPMPFLRLDPDTIDDIDRATTIDGSAEYGTPVDPESVEPIDGIVAGSVAVTPDGDRIGKGEGYSDLEYAILREFGSVSDETRTMTTVHELQLVTADVETDSHDVPIEIVAMPDRLARTEEISPKPVGIEWNAISAEQVEEIPILSRLRDRPD